MNKKTVRLTESDLHKIVKESVNRVLRENNQSALIKGTIYLLSLIRIYVLIPQVVIQDVYTHFNLVG